MFHSSRQKSFSFFTINFATTINPGIVKSTTRRGLSSSFDFDERLIASHFHVFTFSNDNRRNKIWKELLGKKIDCHASNNNQNVCFACFVMT